MNQIEVAKKLLESSGYEVTDILTRECDYIKSQYPGVTCERDPYRDNTLEITAPGDSRAFFSVSLESNGELMYIYKNMIISKNKFYDTLGSEESQAIMTKRGEDLRRSHAKRGNAHPDYGHRVAGKKLTVESVDLQEDTKSKALDKLKVSLEDRLKSVNNSDHPVKITKNPGSLEVSFEGTGDKFTVIPKKLGTVSKSVKKPTKIKDIPGVTIQGTVAYDESGTPLGELMVYYTGDSKASDYSDNIEDAEFNWNDTITDLKHFEKYVGREAASNLN